MAIDSDGDKRLYMLVGLQTDDGKRYSAVGRQGALQVKNFKLQPKPKDGEAESSMSRTSSLTGGGEAPNDGDVVVVVLGPDGIVYVTGNTATATAGSVLAGSPGSSLAMQLMPSTSGTVTRVVIFESSSGFGYVRFDWQRSDANVSIPEGYYVDIVGATVGTPALWDTATVPGAQALMDEINEARAAWGI